MDYCKTIFHVVQPGDTFYRLAQRYRTTVPEIIMRNPGINPYNLQVGTSIRICAGRENETMQMDEMDLNNDMRYAWGQHNFWGAMLMNSLFNALGNTDSVEQRLMLTPEEIAAVFAQFYPQSVVNQLKQLLAEHVRLMEENMQAVRDGNAMQMEETEARLYQNADQIARMLANANSKYDYEELRHMMRKHLALMKNTMMADRNGQYADSVRLVDENQMLMMEMADMLTEGLLEQFYQR